MNTILVPVDFSATAINAAKYAVYFAKQCGVQKLVLYNAFEIPVLSDGGLTVPVVAGSNEIQKSSIERLENLRKELINEFNVIFKIEIKSSFNTVVTGIKEAVKEVGADFIVMGITGGNSVEEVLIGSNSVDLAKNIDTPVLIVPPTVKFNYIRNVLLTTDLKNIIETTPADAIEDIIHTTKAQLHLLNVDTNNQHESLEDIDFESMEVSTLFQHLNPEYHFTKNENFVDGVNKFIDFRGIDLVIAVPKKHSFIQSLFHKSHSNMLAFHSHVPVLMVHLD